MREIQYGRFWYDRNKERERERENEKIERMRKNKEAATRTDGRMIS